ncbi:MAG: type IV secretory system conjugative DNA transfer family protein [Reyranella sp.]|uniref:type IV secretory system conjugative DNA transfer family protein n=1 Tax=Reyranella sp. TaxID=1929291 RepID=UPI0012113125|nr:type IV secretion system DNA-binding domain-containing protein [Reyranella sp.]TAJ36867.1 MAG: type IV secretory system conjugative DNA transfer family protein [Reyranella sp.]
MQERITFIGQVDFRNDRRRFGIKREDRLLHTYVIGKTGTGKSTLLGNMAKQDLLAGGGFALVDPHGDLVDRLHQEAISAGRSDIVYLNAADPRQPYGYNPLRRVRPDRIPLAASGLLEVFKKMWSDAWGVRMEHILRNALYALLEQKEATLLDIPRLFSDRKFRRHVAASLSNEPVRLFWEKEFDRYSFSYRADGVASIQNKLGAFLSDPVMRRILTEPREMISMRRIMDQGGVLLVNLGKGRIGEDSAAILGGLLVTTIGLAAYSRADSPPETRRDFALYIDEFQTFTTLAVANMLAELRKYRLGMVMAHQYLHQLEPEIRHAVLGNAGTLISFRLGAEDAAYIEREFGGRFEARDLLNLENLHMYVKLMIDGQPSKAFSATTTGPIPPVA